MKRQNIRFVGSTGSSDTDVDTDVDGHADWNSMMQGHRQHVTIVAAMPPVCPSCGTQPDPLTLACRC